MENKNIVYQLKIAGDFIKAKEVEQNPNGRLFAVAYFDDGLFRVRIFDNTLKTEEVDEVKVNELIGLDRSTMVCPDFPDPYITCCWVDEYRLFVNLFHPSTVSHYHFIWDICYKKMQGIPSIGDAGLKLHHDSPV
mgnify:CR=1 FL=1